MKKQYIFLIPLLVTFSLRCATIQDLMRDLATKENQLRINGLELSTDKNEKMSYLAQWDGSFADTKSTILRLGGNDSYIKNSFTLLDTAHTQLRNVIKSLITLNLSLGDLNKLTEMVNAIATKVSSATLSVNKSSVAAAVSLVLALEKSLKRIIDTVKTIIEQKKKAITPPPLPPRGTRA